MLVQTQPVKTSQANWTLQPFTGYLPLQSIDTFHHSKTFQANLGVNPLAASAAPLFILITKLNKANGYDDLNRLQRQLIHEIRAFECNAIAQHYNPNVILAARYAIVTALDETIQRSHWGKSQLWEKYALTPYFYREQSEQRFFFSFIPTLITTDNTPLDLLEFCYLCLNLGFVGIHRDDSAEFNQIQELSNRLFAVINHRKPAKKTAPLLAQLKTPMRTKPAANQPHWWLLGAVSAVICISIYLGFNYIMSSSTKPLYAKLDNIVNEKYAQLS